MFNNLKISPEGYLPKSEWEESVKGWVIVDCVFPENDKISILLREDIPHEIASRGWDSDINSRVMTIFFDDGNEKSGHRDFTGFEYPKLGFSQNPTSQRLLLNRNTEGQIYASGSGSEGSEAVKPGATSKESFYGNRLVCIDGWTYALGMVREVHKRIEIGKWEPMMNGFDQPRYEGCASDWGFNDMDGPNENNLYAVGGKGDVWRYDGNKWHWCDFPSNEVLATVTVAPDGQVYISGDGGSLWVGKENTWKQLAKAHSTINYNDSVWFNDQLWLCSDYRLEVWDGKKLDRPVHGDSTIVYSGHMDAHENLLVVAGVSEVHAFDGKEWHTIVQTYD
jgi:hypothetical protein